ncbi:MAG TPA: transcription antitermination factor NusB [Actinomycetes bacterium]|nr:transcription antitermination factor NusB [Actinomycetes bacterium]
MSVDPARRVAFDVMRAVRERDAYANLVLPNRLRRAGFSSRDAAFATELCYGTLRGLGTYDAVIDACVDRPLADLDPAVLDVLRIGAHQLFNMHVPPHAAVATTVDLAADRIGPRPRGFVNAVMRRMSSRTLEQWLAELVPEMTTSTLHRLSIEYSHPEWVVAGLHDVLGSWPRTETALAANNRAPEVVLVARPGRCDVAELVAAGGTPGQWSSVAVRWSAGDPATIPAVRDGRAGIQDEGSQLVALALASASLDGADEHWLDLCAGPGGKAALLAAVGTERGAHLTAVELRPQRAALVEGVGGSNVDVVVGDGTDARWATGTFDRVLVDAPCSGVGALRRRPESRWRRQPSDLEPLQSLQEALLTNAIAAVRVGGIVGYATCSPLRQETIAVVRSVLDGRADVELLDARKSLPDMPSLGVGPDVQLWPHEHGTDAMYLALLRRTAAAVR